MMKLGLDGNELLARKLEDQKVALPVLKELTDQDLTNVTGGGGRKHFKHKRHWHKSRREC